MSERKMKRVEDSLTEQSHLLMPKCLNAAGYLFGGQLLAWIDETAGIVVPSDIFCGTPNSSG